MSKLDPVTGLPVGWSPPMLEAKELHAVPDLMAGDLVSKFGGPITPVVMPLPSGAYPVAFNPDSQFNSPAEMSRNSGPVLVGDISEVYSPTMDGGFLQPLVWVLVILAGVYFMSQMKGK